MQARRHTTDQRAARPRQAARRQVNGSSARPPGLLTPRALAAWAAEMDVDPAAVGLDGEGYPYCDGEPMGQNYRQSTELGRLIAMLDGRYGRRSDVYLAFDVFVHHGGSEDEELESAAPDVCVAFGARRDPNRMMYKLWEPGDPTPDFVLEILSPRTKRDRYAVAQGFRIAKSPVSRTDMGGPTWSEGAPFTTRTPGKPGRYARMGIREFWLYDPLGTDIPAGVAGYRLDGAVYRPLPRRPDGAWRSGALGVDLYLAGDELKLRDVATGQDVKDIALALEYGEREHEGRLRSHEAHRREREAHDETKSRLADAEARQAASDAEIARLRAELGRRGTRTPGAS